MMCNRFSRTFSQLLVVLLVLAAILPVSARVQAAAGDPKPPKVAVQGPVGLENGPEAQGRPALRPMQAGEDGQWTAPMQGQYSARFSPHSQGGYEIRTARNQAIRFVPRGADKVKATEQMGYLTYPGLWPDTDLRLSVTPDRMKEEIVLQRPVAVNRWEFDLQVRNLTMWSGPAGELYFGPSAQEQPVFAISGLIAEDAAGAQAPVTAEVNSDGTAIALTVDPAWLSAPERQYPVVVDPTAQAVGGLTNGQEVFELTDGTLVIVSDKLQWRVSKDGGQTWLTPTTSLMPPGYTSLVHATVDIMPDGTVHLVGGNYNTSKGCTNGYYDELFYWRTTLTADRLSVNTWSAATTVLSLCNATQWWMSVDMAAFDAGATTYVHVAYDLGSQNSTTYEPIGYMKYKRLTVTDSTGAVTAGSTYSLATTYVINGYEIAVDRTRGNLLLAYGQMEASYLNNTYYWFNRWSGTAYASTSAGTKYTWCTGDLCADQPYDVSYDSAGRFQLADGSIFRWIEVNPASPSAPMQIAELPERSTTAAQAIAVAPGDRPYVFYGDKNNSTIYSASWDRTTNTWTPYTTLFTSVGATPLAVRRGPGYNTVDLAWGGTTWFSRLQFDAPGAASVTPENGAWLNTRTPTFTWSFGDSNAGDSQAAFQVVVRDGTGAIAHDSGRRTGSTRSYTPSTALPADGAFTWSVTVWDNVGVASTPTASSGFTVDSTAPTGSVTINRSGEFTNSGETYLELPAQDAFGVTNMRFAVDGGAWSEWEPYAATKWLTIPVADGTRKVAVQYRDQIGNLSASAEDSVTMLPGFATASLLIHNGAPATSAASVLLTVDAVNNPVQMRFKNEADATFSAWVPYARYSNWSLTPGSGDRTVTVQVSDLNGTTAEVSATIRLN